MKEYKINKDVLWEIFEDKTLVFIPKKKTFYELNETGSFIWKILSEKQSDSIEISEQLTEEYEIDKDRAINVTTDFLQDLIKKNLVN